MFQIHEIYRPTKPVQGIPGPVRVIDAVGFEKVVLIDMNTENQRVPFPVRYPEWISLLSSNALELAPDPFLRLTSAPVGLPPAAEQRLKSAIEATSTLSQKPTLLHQPRTLAKEIASVSKSMGLSRRTIKRWVLDWLQAGRNPAAVVREFIETTSEGAKVGLQTRGAKRGASKTKPETVSDAPAHEVRAKCEEAYGSYVKAQKKTWTDAYYEMLIELCGIPEDELRDSERGLLMDPVLIEKYRPPSWLQCRYVFRKLKKKESAQGEDNPRGKRGKATDNVPGPGFYEIDATFFQIQLVSRVTKSELVGRPTVYLIVDVYDGVIVGYAVTLDNPSWATAALALYNCFSEKGATFARLGLPYTSKDWHCCHLPTVLRADRAELVSNMGMEFPASGVRVEVTPSMTPIAKGTVEGKHSEVKKPRPSRFDLPGRFKKIRERRQSDGKKGAALDILEFERILVEMIMDLNGEPVDPRRIPPDAIHEGSSIASRIGFHEWALKNRAGFTRKMGPHFVYEHLLTKAKGVVTPLGIKLENEMFACDRLREMGYLLAAAGAHFDISVSYHPNYAGEVFFFDKEKDAWIAAHNIDPEIDRFKMTFAEAKEYRALQALLVEQAAFDNHARRRKRVPAVREEIRAAVAEKASQRIKTSASNAHIRHNRARERAAQRSAGLNGALQQPHMTGEQPRSPAPVAAAASEPGSPVAPSLPSSASADRSGTNALALWDEIDSANNT
ncbi:MAG TPA: hypothetical protein PK306_21630 [Aquabacterium sp.]|nr:hypothetical protein [Aquabacterium sp.]